MKDIQIYAPIISLYRDCYAKQADYLKDYWDYNNHYGYKVRVVGGWKFFEFEQDYKTWKNQK